MTEQDKNNALIAEIRAECEKVREKNELLEMATNITNREVEEIKKLVARLDQEIYFLRNQAS